MKKTLVILILFLIAFIFRSDIQSFYVKHFGNSFPQLTEIATGLKEAGRDIIAPGPLRAVSSAVFGTPLTPEGVITWTNNNRADNNLPKLAYNLKLAKAAEQKVADMFAGQFFEHKAPDGTTAGDLVKDEEYDYVVVGENLALGNFKNDEALVEAWMNSPGHRANILNTRFQEIGVAVKKGIFEGKTTWLAVQMFGKAAAACPAVDVTLKANIEANQKKAESMQIILDEKQKELENRNGLSREEYNSKVGEYNKLVGEYNALVKETKAMAADYNAGVRIFNICASS